MVKINTSNEIPDNEIDIALKIEYSFLKKNFTKLDNNFIKKTEEIAINVYNKFDQE